MRDVEMSYAKVDQQDLMESGASSQESWLLSPRARDYSPELTVGVPRSPWRRIAFVGGVLIFAIVIVAICSHGASGPNYSHAIDHLDDAVTMNELPKGGIYFDRGGIPRCPNEASGRRLKDVLCPSHSFQHGQNVIYCTSNHGCIEMDVPDQKVVQVTALPPGSRNVRMIFDANADVDLHVMQNGECIAGYGCKFADPCADDAPCHKYHSKNVTELLYFSGDDTNVPVREVFSVDDVVGSEIQLKVKGYAPGLAAARFTFDKLAGCTADMPLGCKPCAGSTECPEGTFPVCDGSTKIKCAKPSKIPALYFAYAGTALLLLICIVCRLCRKWRYRYRYMDINLPSEPEARKVHAKQELQKAFDAQAAFKYRCALELALDAGVKAEEIPLVLQLTRDVASCNQLSGSAARKTSLSVQLCFVLDYTGSMGTQMAQVQSNLTKIVESVQNLKIDHMPDCKVDLEMTAVAYNDWDSKTKSKGRPVVAIFGGQEIKEDHSESLTPSSFNLGGKFTRSADDLRDFVKQDLGSGGAIPEELTGGLIAASHLRWSAECRMCVVITDAPCHGKDYHNCGEDEFVDKSTGLSCSGRPEDALRALKEKQVELSILHTNTNVQKMLDAFKKVMPNMKQSSVSPSGTGDYLVKMMKDRLGVQPLSYRLSNFGLDEIERGEEIAVGHTLQVKDGDDKLTNNYGLAWIGLRPGSSASFEALVVRPAEASLDSMFSTETEKHSMKYLFEDKHSIAYSMQVRKA